MDVSHFDFSILLFKVDFPPNNELKSLKLSSVYLITAEGEHLTEILM